jgi:hypothetical protein
MSNRNPAECNLAKQRFWDRERRRIKKGVGTRDWTPEQQKAILNLNRKGIERKHAGVPRDDVGKSIEAHHMKSAEKYPEFQGNGKNMQPLTHDEHISAHDGSYKNATNGYYNPATKEVHSFDKSAPKPVKPKSLSNSIFANEGKQNASESSAEKLSSSADHSQPRAPPQRNNGGAVYYIANDNKSKSGEKPMAEAVNLQESSNKTLDAIQSKVQNKAIDGVEKGVKEASQALTKSGAEQGTSR